jgi:hypothetical protein
MTAGLPLRHGRRRAQDSGAIRYDQ